MGIAVPVILSSEEKLRSIIGESIKSLPVESKSMPFPPLQKIEFPRTVIKSVVSFSTKTPAPSLKATIFPSPELVPPTIFDTVAIVGILKAEKPKNIPTPLFGIGVTPSIPVPQ